MFFYCSLFQLAGFIYACYVVKLISEEEDSCKYLFIYLPWIHFFVDVCVCLEDLKGSLSKLHTHGVHTSLQLCNSGSLACFFFVITTWTDDKVCTASTMRESICAYLLWAPSKEAPLSLIGPLLSGASTAAPSQRGPKPIQFSTPLWGWPTYSLQIATFCRI